MIEDDEIELLKKATVKQLRDHLISFNKIIRSQTYKEVSKMKKQKVIDILSDDFRISTTKGKKHLTYAGKIKIGIQKDPKTGKEYSDPYQVLHNKYRDISPFTSKEKTKEKKAKKDNEKIILKIKKKKKKK